MIFRAVTLSGDWKLGKGKQDFLQDIEATKANILTRLKSWKGDCFFAVTEGVDYNNFLSVGTQDFLERDIKRVILQSQDVIRINTFESSLDRETRDLTITSEIDTIFGVLEVAENV